MREDWKEQGGREDGWEEGRKEGKEEELGKEQPHTQEETLGARFGTTIEVQCKQEIKDSSLTSLNSQHL